MAHSIPHIHFCYQIVFSYAHSTTVSLLRSLHITYQDDFATEQERYRETRLFQFWVLYNYLGYIPLELIEVIAGSHQTCKSHDHRRHHFQKHLSSWFIKWLARFKFNIASDIFIAMLLFRQLILCSSWMRLWHSQTDCPEVSRTNRD